METLKRLSSPLLAGLSCGLVLALASMWQAPRAAADSVQPSGTSARTATVPSSYSSRSSGERAGSTTAVQLPDVAAKMVRIKARSNNAGSVFLGTSSSATVADGTTDTTTGFELSAGQDTGWMPAANLNEFYIRCSNASDDITYLALN